MLFKIEFEDHGQDFLSWTIDTQKEEVVDCEPFQGNLWIGRRVTQKAFEVGGKVEFFISSGAITAIKYPINRIEIITA